MKCVQYFPKHIKAGVQFDRLPDSEADRLVAAHMATYAPKRLWKKHTRDVAESVIEDAHA